MILVKSISLSNSNNKNRMKFHKLGKLKNTPVESSLSHLEPVPLGPVDLHVFAHRGHIRPTWPLSQFFPFQDRCNSVVCELLPISDFDSMSVSLTARTLAAVSSSWCSLRRHWRHSDTRHGRGTLDKASALV